MRKINKVEIVLLVFIGLSFLTFNQRQIVKAVVQLPKTKIINNNSSTSQNDQPQNKSESIINNQKKSIGQQEESTIGIKSYNTKYTYSVKKSNNYDNKRQDINVKNYSSTINYVPERNTPNTWKVYDNKWCYYNNEGNLNRNEGAWLGDNLFYFNNNGVAAQNTWKQGGNEWYYFGNDGHAYRNEFSWLDSKLFYFKSDATAAQNMWKQGINNWYYFGENRYAYKNRGAWLGGNLFYFKATSAAVQNMWKQGGNEWYYFGNDGHAYRNKLSWIKDDLFCFNLDGTAVKKSWRQDDLNWYYFGNDGHAYRNKYAQISGVLYYFDNSGHVLPYSYKTKIVISKPREYLQAVINYGNSTLANGNSNPDFRIMTDQLKQLCAKGMKDNSELDPSLDIRPVDLQYITHAEQVELSKFMIEIVNSIRSQLGLSRWYYDSKIQGLANDIAKYYNQDNMSILSDDHDMHAISKAAREHGIKFYLLNPGEYNIVEDEGGFYPLTTSGKSTMGEIKTQIYWNLKQMFFGGATSEEGPFIEMFHASDLTSSDNEAIYGKPNSDGSVPAAISISYLHADNIASTHFIAVRPGYAGMVTR